MPIINEIFKSVSGEAGHPNFPQGTFCAFIRFQKCDLCCKWCDTEYARTSGGQLWETDDIVKAVSDTERIVITGGEPQVQQFHLSVLVRKLLHAGKKIQIETNGAHLPVDFSPNVTWVVDYKLPSSGMEERMLSTYVFAEMLRKRTCVVKFVFDDEIDIEKMIVKIIGMIDIIKMKFICLPFAPFILSPTENGRQFSKLVVEKIFENNLQEYCLFSLQSHKILNLK